MFFSLEFISNHKTSKTVRGLTCVYTKGYRFKKESFPGKGPTAIISTIFPQTPEECSPPPVFLTLSRGWEGAVWLRVGGSSCLVGVGTGLSWAAGVPPPPATLGTVTDSTKPHCFTQFGDRNLEKTKVGDFQLSFSLLCCLWNKSFYGIFVVSEVMGEVPAPSQFKNRLNVRGSWGHPFNPFLTMVISKTVKGSILN